MQVLVAATTIARDAPARRSEGVTSSTYVPVGETDRHAYPHSTPAIHCDHARVQIIALPEHVIIVTRGAIELQRLYEQSTCPASIARGMQPELRTAMRFSRMTVPRTYTFVFNLDGSERVADSLTTL